MMASSSSISDGGERKESGVGLLTLEDLKLHHVDINKKLTKFEALLAVTEISCVKWEERREKRMNMAKTLRLLREKTLKKPIILHVEEKGIAIKDKEFVGEKLPSSAIKFGKELNQKKNVRINTSLKRINPDCEKDKNWDAVFENGQERRKRYRKGNSKMSREVHASKHGSRDARAVRLPKESSFGEKRKLKSKDNKDSFGSGNGRYLEEYSSSKRVMERVEDGMNDRWNGEDDDRGEGTNKLKEKSSESRSKRRDESAGAYGESEEVVKKGSKKSGKA
ncbi:hypothetical protein GH714_001103 [Hevea brasiliensis]|uniref:Uncharacterized protein n=1 Tax=Hevea brasiliensis TaxID=3981 RepID=A0A6A6KWH5_HEVBR|nr:hypothetical protein GH714_001103 [Hevea brasiliensis]